MLTYAYKAMFPILLEMMGLVGTFIGIYLGFYCLDIYDPIIAFNMMMLWSVTCAGFASFLGSLFFRQSTSKAFGWKFGATFQIERAFYHLAFAIATMTLYFGDWGIQAMLAVAYIYALNLFFELSLHLYDIVRYQVRSIHKFFHIIANTIIISYLAYFALTAHRFNP